MDVHGFVQMWKVSTQTEMKQKIKKSARQRKSEEKYYRTKKIVWKFRWHTQRNTVFAMFIATAIFRNVLTQFIVPLRCELNPDWNCATTLILTERRRWWKNHLHYPNCIFSAFVRMSYHRRRHHHHQYRDSRSFCRIYLTIKRHCSILI